MPGSSRTPSPIFIWSLPSIAPRSARMRRSERAAAAGAVPLASCAAICPAAALPIRDAQGARARLRGRGTRARTGEQSLGPASARRRAQIVDRLERAVLLVMPEGPAVAGHGALHMGADLVDRALRAGAGDASRRRGPSPRGARPDRRARCRARSGRARPARRTECASRRACPWRLASEAASSGFRRFSRSRAASA